MSSKSKNISSAQPNYLKPSKHPLGTGPNKPTHLYAGYLQLEQTYPPYPLPPPNVAPAIDTRHASSHSAVAPGSVISGKQLPPKGGSGLRAVSEVRKYF